MQTGKAVTARPATYRVTLGYDGTQFSGYARQPDRCTVEGVLRSGLAPFLNGRRPALACGGRTDRGVHAIGQVVSFKLPGDVALAEIGARLDNQHPGLWIEDVRRAPSWFHAHFSARCRHYVYLAPAPPQTCPRRLQRQLDMLQGRRCFSAFARDTPAGQNTNKRLMRATVRAETIEGAPGLRFDLQADGFLRRMVRVLVATGLKSAHRDAPDDALAMLAERGERRATESPAPPDRLYLTAIRYDPEPVRR